MGIDDRDYMRERNRKPVIYNPKEFRGGRTLCKPPKKGDSSGVLKSISVWMVVALVFWLIFQHFESKKINNSNLSAITLPRIGAAEQQFPESSSTIQYQQITSPGAKLTVLSEQGKAENCVIKLETWDSGIPVIELFVRAGERGETQLVPLGGYRTKIVCGERWYGRNEMFGKGSRVSIGTTPLQFWQSGNTINGQTLTLTKRIDGNFKTNDSYYNQF